MNKLFWCFASCCLFLFCGVEKNQVEKEVSKPEKEVLEFTITLNDTAYRYTNFGEPPQMAIWFEKAGQEQFKTVWVTHRAGINDWKGKIECAVALPFWDSRKLYYKKEHVDIATGATPKNTLSVITAKPGEGKWIYFVEVNVSGDYNAAFGYWSKNKVPDSEGNGQPSLVYSGAVDFDLKQFEQVTLAGRTKQFGIVTSLEKDLAGITSAKTIIKDITAKFLNSSVPLVN